MIAGGKALIKAETARLNPDIKDYIEILDRRKDRRVTPTTSLPCRRAELSPTPTR